MSGHERGPLVPRLRFPEFQEAGAWEDMTVAEVCEINPSRTNKQDHELVSFIPMAAVSEDGRIENPRIRTYADVKKGYTAFVENDIIVAKITPCFENGKAALARNLKNGAGFGSTEFHVFRAKKSCLPEFLFLQLCRDDVRAAGTRSMVGNAGQRRVPVSFFEVFHFYIPTIEEQQKIADCFSSLDDLIMAETQKLAIIKTHKKGLMQQLFPREGETVPRLRFPQFREAAEWKEKTLGQLGELISGLTYSPDDVRDEGLLVLRSSNVHDGRIVLDDNVYVRQDIKGTNPSLPNDILICVRNGSKSLIGKNALIHDSMPLCTHGAFMTVFRSSSAKFIIQLLQTEAYEKQVAADLGATINSINGNQLKKYKFFVPGQQEQQKIADFLLTIDSIIAAQSQKIVALKTFKQGLMQQLFPALDEMSA